jgi:hypothetical protein
MKGIQPLAAKLILSRPHRPLWFLLRDRPPAAGHFRTDAITLFWTPPNLSFLLQLILTQQVDSFFHLPFIYLWASFAI